MRRMPVRRQATSMTLFPFLAVLICTMGSLIVLLVLVVKQAEVQASEHRVQDEVNRAETLRKKREQLEDQRFLQDTLAEQRPQMTQKLTDARLELSHLDNHIRELKQQAEQLGEQLKDLEQIDKIRNEDRSGTAAELDRVRRQIDLVGKQLEDARRIAKQQPRSFSIIPYKGPNGTNRRPIYVECTRESVIIQPEGVVLRETDFLQPLVPGNPLDAALLAVREYLAKSGAIHREAEPYPLLIVRSGGAEAYSLARSAMKSWDDEFGYELIDANLKLKFPPADPALERTIREAIDLARLRQEALARAQPSRFQGGIGQNGVGGGSENDGTGRHGSGSGGAGNSDRVVLRPNPRGGGFIREGGRSNSDPVFDSPSSNDGFGPPNSSRPGQPNGTGNSNAGSRQPSENAGQPGNAFGSNRSGGGGGQPGSSQSRGANWGLRDWSPDAIPYTRPIRVICRADRLEIVPQVGSGQRARVTPLKAAMNESIDEFVSTVWEHIKGWGIAGRNAYWKPVLNVEVAPGAERRFTEMNGLLQNSGLVVRRKGA